MKNKLLIITFFAVVLLVNTLLFLFVGIDREDSSDILHKTLFFWLTGAAYLFSCYFLFSEIRKINDKILQPLVIITVAITVVLHFRYGGAFARSGYLTDLFKEPLLWMFAATLIGNIVLFVYKRNKPQIN